MNATDALERSNDLVSGLIGNLTTEHREMRTPCDQWNVHELIEHMCGGAHMIASGLQDQPPETDASGLLDDGPAVGWENASEVLSAAATPDALGATHQLPFGEVPGEVALSVIVADHVTHAWDLAQATSQRYEASDELATFALEAWKPVVPVEGRTGDGFKPAVPVADDASAVDKLVGYTGRTPR